MRIIPPLLTPNCRLPLFERNDEKNLTFNSHLQLSLQLPHNLQLSALGSYPDISWWLNLWAWGRYPYTGFFGTLRNRDRRIVDEALASFPIAEVVGGILTVIYFKKLYNNEIMKRNIKRHR